MKPTLLLLSLVLALGVADAADVFVTKDAQGRPVYTDRPEQLPAQRINVATKDTDAEAVRARYDAQMKKYGESDQQNAVAAARTADAKAAKELTAVDRAKRCEEARERYVRYMNSRRMYEPGERDGERRYLSDAELDSAREDARKVMDELCGES